MKELGKTKSYDLSKLNEEQIEQLAEYVNKMRNETHKMRSIDDAIKWFNQCKNSLVLIWFESDNLWGFRSRQPYSLPICATTLFDEDIWVPKQGEKVYVSDSIHNDWRIRTFVVKHNNIFYTEHKNNNNTIILQPWAYIKPYKEEIKVGDWVKHINAILKINGGESNQFLLECTKITDKNTIHVLESILVD